ncbi:hypothetical protein GHT06_005060 [Daphnia sinensis]|uniref:Uncharacterized protein n=1 Tax=Daphnia sinensis TaxID=1820382 RepID=A0AAD5PMB8_9CRUS|nr:hypothetical protein GHT06_005060 [Daphnia sinensis]
MKFQINLDDLLGENSPMLSFNETQGVLKACTLLGELPKGLQGKRLLVAGFRHLDIWHTTTGHLPIDF